MKFKNVDLFARGKRSIIYIRKSKDRTIAFKRVIDSNRTRDVIKNEVNFLKILNRHQIGPKLLKYNRYYVSYEFVEGIRIGDFVKTVDRVLITKVLLKVLNQCFIMDTLKINKKEMHHPVKHIFVKDNNPTMIDFERCYFTKNPKNVTQFCQFLTSSKMSKILKNKGIKINKIRLIKLLKKYKKYYKKDDFNMVIKLIS